MLTTAQLPLHATRDPRAGEINGGDEQVAGTSPTPDVSLLGLLTYWPGGSMEAWVVGHN